jgi:hypothetical protein
MGLQQCIRTVRVEKNTNGCSGYRLSPGDGYIVKIYNDDLGKPNMSDKPMRIVSKTSTKVELRGFPIEAQTPFGWQEVDYRDYGFTIYYTNGKVSKCVLHMFDRNVDLEYRQTAAQNQPQSTITASGVKSIRSIVSGETFEINTHISVIKQFYNQTSEEVKLTSPSSAKIKRETLNGPIYIAFQNLCELQTKGIIQSNLTLSPNFQFNQDNDDEFATAEINNSFAAMTSGKEYISLFQITKQKGQIVSFLINNLPNEGDFYYLIILR